VITHQARKRGRLAIAIERAATIRQEDQRDATRAQHSVRLVQEAERIREMFDHMRADHEVLTARFDGGQTLGVDVRDHIWFRKLRVGRQLGKETSIVDRSPSVYVANDRALRHHERLMTRTDFDSRAGEGAGERGTTTHPRAARRMRRSYYAPFLKPGWWDWH
jgi:hypothetical protein